MSFSHRVTLSRAKRLTMFVERFFAPLRTTTLLHSLFNDAQYFSLSALRLGEQFPHARAMILDERFIAMLPKLIVTLNAARATRLRYQCADAAIACRVLVSFFSDDAREFEHLRAKLSNVQWHVGRVLERSLNRVDARGFFIVGVLR